MPEFLQIVSALKEQMNASLSRSDVLRPLILLLGLSIFTLTAAITAKADAWIIVTAFSFLGLIIVSYLSAYFYFAFKNPDALRSEKYSLNKMAIEHGWRGDSTAGLIEESSKKRRAPKVIENNEEENDG